MTQITQRKSALIVITYLVAKRLWRQFFFGVRRRVAAFQNGAKAPHSKKRLQVTAYGGVPSMRLDALCLCHTPPLAPLPACGEGMGVGSTQRRRCQRKTRWEHKPRVAVVAIWVGNYPIPQRGAVYAQTPP